MFHILIVCTANVCRSPLAEAALKSLLSQKSVRVSSCGTRAIAGNRADPAMCDIALQKGWGDLNDFRSRPLLPSTLKEADLVLCMEEHHVQDVLAAHPLLHGRVKLFGHWEASEISDPVNQGQDLYLRCAEQVGQAAASWEKNLRQMSLI